MRYLITSSPTWEADDSTFNSSNSKLVHSYKKKLVQGERNNSANGPSAQCKPSTHSSCQSSTGSSHSIFTQLHEKSRERRVNAVSGEWYRRECLLDLERVPDKSVKTKKSRKVDTLKQRKSAKGSNIPDEKGSIKAKEINSDPELHQCTTCGKVLRSKSTLKVHQVVHVDDKPHKCTTCEKSFKTKSSLSTHTKIHSGEKPFKCSYCGRSFAKRYRCNYHEATHDISRRLSCETCGLTFAAAGCLNRHIRVKHTPLGNPYKCSICDKGFHGLQKLKDHQNRHTGETPYECKICHKKLMSRECLYQHEKSHTPIANRPIKCQLCGKGFFYENILRRHAEVCQKTKTFDCKFCTRTFLDKKDMEIHRISHIGEQK